MRIKLREPSLLPRTIPLATIDQLLRHVYSLQSIYNKRTYAYRVVVRDVAVLELLFATGIRISELCSLQPDDVGLQEGSIKIYGKGAKERLIQIGHQNVLHALRNYTHYWSADIQTVNHFFLNRLGNPLSDQSVRCMIKKYCNQSGISLHIHHICFAIHLPHFCWKKTLICVIFSSFSDTVPSQRRRFTHM